MAIIAPACRQRQAFRLDLDHFYLKSCTPFYTTNGINGGDFFVGVHKGPSINPLIFASEWINRDTFNLRLDKLLAGLEIIAFHLQYIHSTR